MIYSWARWYTIQSYNQSIYQTLSLLVIVRCKVLQKIWQNKEHRDKSIHVYLYYMDKVAWMKVHKTSTNLNHSKGPQGIATLKYKFGRGTLLQFILNSHIYITKFINIQIDELNLLISSIFDIPWPHYRIHWSSLH